MSRWTRLAGRTVASVVGASVVLSLAFLLSAVTPSGQRAARGSLLDRYLAWLVDFATLDWGQSRVGGAPVVDALAAAIPTTLAYLVPAVLLATLVGVLLGSYAALHPDGRVDRTASLLAYGAWALPNFVVGSVLVLLFFVDPLLSMPVYEDTLAQRVLWPAALLSTTLLATQFRYARAQSREYAGTDFVTLVRAKGGGDGTVVRHVIRNAALPLFSLFVVEAFAVLAVAVAVIESLFGIPGIGRLLLVGVWTHDVPTVLGTTVVFVVAGFAGNLLQDAAYAMLDPRVESN